MGLSWWGCSGGVVMVAMVMVDMLLLSVCGGGGYCLTRVVDTFSLTRDGVVVDALLLLLVVVIVRRMASGRWWWCGCCSQGGGVGCRSTCEGGWRSRGGRSTVRTNLVTDPSPTKTGTGMLRVIFFSPVPVPWYPIPVTHHGVTYLCPSLVMSVKEACK